MSFTAASLRFLRGLARNNKKPWFEAHRDDYETHIRVPMRALIEEMDVRFARFAPELTGDPKRSMFRINRDIRFSKDKSPYKTHAACWFRHSAADHRVGGDAEAGSAGLYFHLQPRQSFVGAGIWMPPRPALDKIRDAIADDPGGFGRIIKRPAARRRYGGLDDEAMLKRMPRGFSDGHPAGEWLRYQSFTIGRQLSDRDVLSPRLAEGLERDFRLMLPLVRWLNVALGLEAASRPAL
ncbi:MAG TPA: DUF2461 domain-containing protein [Gemmatimonadales bacterium]|nr:DUF2461 domain-containing protein [Gemmatimonadales bacterium]